MNVKTTGSANPHLLFLAYPFPPSPAIGAVRAWNIAKQLSRLGWQVTVVTPNPVAVDSEVHQTVEQECREAGIRRLLSGTSHISLGRPAPLRSPRWLRSFVQRGFWRLFRSIGIGPDEGWLLSCLKGCHRLKPGDFDLVLATGSPFSSFLTAAWVATRLRIPYVLDYRDPWSQSAFDYLAQWKWWSQPLERRVLGKAAACTIVSPSLAALQADAFPLSRSPAVVTNGYDPEAMAAIEPHRFKDFAVVYTGSFYTGQREIDPVIQAVQAADGCVSAAGPRIRLHYFGADSNYVRERAERHGALPLVQVHGRVPWTQALAAAKGAGVVAVIAGIRNRVDAAERGIVTGKLFEPLGLGVPILLVAAAGSDATAIVETAGAGRGFPASESVAMGEWLAAMAMREDRGRYTPPAEFSWPEIARRLDTLLRSCL